MAVNNLCNQFGPRSGPTKYLLQFFLYGYRLLQLCFFFCLFVVVVVFFVFFVFFFFVVVVVVLFFYYFAFVFLLIYSYFLIFVP